MLIPELLDRRLIIMKKFTVAVIATAVLGLSAYTLAGAHAAEWKQDRQEAGVQDGRGPRRGPGFGRGFIPFLRDLDLTETQKQQIQTIRESARESRDTPPADVQLHRQLQTELFADAPDAQKIAALQQQLAQAHAARLAKQIALEQKIAQVLTAEQRAKVRERLAEAPSRGWH
jgi:Spy/CpxP family protein refolding chaperone